MLPFILAESTITVPSALGTLMSAIWVGVTQVVTNVIASPLLIIGVVLGFAASMVGLAKRLMGTGRRRRR